MTTPIELTTLQQTVLAGCENTIERTRTSFVECGKALERIRDERLYRQTHDNFDDYCQERWGWSRQRTHQLIESAETVSRLPKKLSTMVDSERSARALTAVPESDRKEVLKAAAKDGIVTAAKITEIAQEMKQPEKPKPKEPEPIEAELVDEIGHTIPKEILLDWQRAQATGTELRTMASRLKCTVEKGIKDDVVFREISNVDIANFEAAHFTLRQIIPHTICPTCRGRSTRKTCKLCKQRGFLSKHSYTTHVTPEIRKLHEKVSK